MLGSLAEATVSESRPKMTGSPAPRGSAQHAPLRVIGGYGKLKYGSQRMAHCGAHQGPPWLV